MKFRRFLRSLPLPSVTSARFTAVLFICVCGSFYIGQMFQRPVMETTVYTVKSNNLFPFIIKHLSAEELIFYRGFFTSMIFPPSDTNPAVYLDHKSKLGFCIILKNMSTIMQALLCKRGGTMSLENTPFLDGPTTNRFQGCARTLPLLNSTADDQWTDTSWKYWTLVRDPFDRFLSGWSDQCAKSIDSRGKHECYACMGNVTCFLNRLHEDLTALSQRKPQPYSGTRTKVNHFYPQMWYCGLYEHYDIFRIIRYDKGADFKSWFRVEFALLGYGTDILDRGWGKSGSRGFLEELSPNAVEADPAVGLEIDKHRAMELEIRNHVTQQLQNSPQLMEQYLKVYLIDHVFLRFSVPPWTKDLCEKCNKKTNCDKLLICTVNAHL